MKTKVMKITAICALFLAANMAVADVAKSEKHAKKATKLRHSVFTMLGANMGTLGAMAKGRIPLNAEVVETNALRLNQLSYMISDYTKTDTSGFKVNSDALAKVWTDRKEFEQRINNLTLASAELLKIAPSGNEKAIKSAIGRVGKTCGGCHDIFKKD